MTEPMQYHPFSEVHKYDDHTACHKEDSVHRPLAFRRAVFGAAVLLFFFAVGYNPHGQREDPGGVAQVGSSLALNQPGKTQNGTMNWYNSPPSLTFEDDGGEISFTVPGQTDFWRTTYHGFIKDDGPFYFQKVTGDFEAVVKISGDYGTLYDQAGLMVRGSHKSWMKCCVELIDGIQHASTVITREFSDRSILPIPSNPETIWFKAKRTKECIETFYSLDGLEYVNIRQGFLSRAETLEVGVVAAAPRGDGFVVKFEEFEVRQ